MAAAILLLAAIPPALAVSAGAQTSGRGGPPALQPRTPASKAAIAAPAAGNQRVTLKFAEGSGVRLRGGAFVAPTGAEVAGVNAVIAGLPGTTVSRLFSRPEADLANEKVRTEARSGRQQADFNLYYRVVAPQGADVAALIAALNKSAVVEAATPEPVPVKAPVTPDFTGDQGYRFTAPDGINANFAATVAGGKGQNIIIADIEYSWNVNHEDLTKAPGAVINNGTPNDPFNSTDHGTAVLGEIVGDENAFGATGVVSGAGLRIVNADTTMGYGLANAINLAAAAMTAGDVILIEQQTTGPNGGCNAMTQVGCAPVEWVQAFYDAIVAATGAGIIVVEAAGNGTQDLDGAEYNPMTSRADSGAIIVGAGGAPCGTARSRLGFSNFGARVNVQGWGQCVVTTGYGDLQGGPVNEFYTETFGGTSSASPIVAGAAGVISSVSQQRGVTLTPQQVRQILIDTGTPQVFGAAGHIGPLPNLFRALARVSCSTPPPATITVAGPGLTTFGTPGNDVIIGTAGNDRIAGLGGNDIVIGGGGLDDLQGGEGDDVLCGGTGADRLTGGNGNDYLQGDAGNDDLSGTGGDDGLYGGADHDRLAGGLGTDVCSAGGQGGDSAPVACETVT